MKCSGHVYYYVRKLGGEGGGKGEKRREFFRAGEQFECLEVGEKFDIVCTVEPSITDTVGDQMFVRYSEVSLTQGLPVYFR